MSVAEQIFNVQLPIQLSYLDDDEKLNFRSRKSELTAKYREIAINALSQEQERPNWIESEVPESTERIFIDVDRAFNLKKGERTGKTVFIRWNDELTVLVQDATETHNEVVTRFRIRPKNEWNLGIKQICAFIKSYDITGFIIAWKIIEAEIQKKNLKADLVQLNGYYQYPPRIQCDFETIDDNLLFLRSVVEGSLTRSFIRTEDLATEWGVTEEEVVEKAELMRSLGYEIRNHNTNPQIEEGVWLIPYPFPTLTPRSIQLHKKLR